MDKIYEIYWVIICINLYNMDRKNIKKYILHVLGLSDNSDILDLDFLTKQLPLTKKVIMCTDCDGCILDYNKHFIECLRLGYPEYELDENDYYLGVYGKHGDEHRKSCVDFSEFAVS